MTKEQLEALANGMSYDLVLAMAAPDPEAEALAAKAIADAATAAQAKAALDALNPPEELTLDAAKAQIVTLTASADEATTKAEAHASALGLARTENESLKAAASAAQTLIDGMSAALASPLAQMSVALNQPVKVEGMSASDVLSNYTSMSAKFRDTFKAGRQSRSEDAANKVSATAKADAAIFADAKSLKF